MNLVNGEVPVWEGVQQGVYCGTEDGLFHLTPTSPLEKDATICFFVYLFVISHFFSSI